MLFVWMIGCLPYLPDATQVEILDNPSHDWDNDGVTEKQGDCDDNDWYITEEFRAYEDADGDGFVNREAVITLCSFYPPENYILEIYQPEEDCDDTDALIHPDANDICDGIDNDCDGLVDNDINEATQWWYWDADGDGFGRPIEYNEDGSFVDENGDGYPDTAIQSCNAPNNHVTNNIDCDDEDPDNFPNNLETCDGLDNNCNGVVDEPSAIDAKIWFADSDMDGFPFAGVYRVQCDQPEGYILAREDEKVDCLDQDPNVHPEAAEDCNQKDDNCDGFVDNDVTLGVVQCFLDRDGDGFGDESEVTLSCECSNERVAQAGDCNDFDSEIYPTEVETCNGIDDNCDGLIDNNAIDPVVYYEDVDGDGFGGGNTFLSCPVSDGNGGWVEPTGFVILTGDCDDGDVELNLADLDGDGQSTCAGDCDDQSANRFVGASELCNGLDDDCDGAIDDNPVNPTVYYQDLDGDGVGSAVTLLSCPVSDGSGGWMDPEGYAVLTGDCDDQNSSVSPLMTEKCEPVGVDENCDGHETLGAFPFHTFYADTDGDGFGNPNYALEGCNQPLGYIEVNLATVIADCDDSDATTFPGAVEVCNGKLDDCVTDDGALTPPLDEVDGDGDFFVECTGFDVNTWRGDTAILDHIVSTGSGGGGDCDPDDAQVYPGAPEFCDGIFQDCLDVDRGIETSPALERDDDFDGYVECAEFDFGTWAGDANVVAGGDCDDAEGATYPGSVNLPATNECFSDVNQDLIADCGLDETGSLVECEPIALLDFYGKQMDFVYIPAGSVTTGSNATEYGRKASNEPQVTVSFSHDWYALSSEVTQGMYEATAPQYEAIWKQTHDEFIGIGSDYPVYWMTWHLAVDFANAVTQRHNDVKGETLSLCYTCQNPGTENVTCEESMNPYTCDGYRLPTYVEWEYMARGDTTDAFWTPDGIGHIPSGVDASNPTNAVDYCTDTAWVFDGGNGDNSTLSAYTLDDFAWYCGNANGEVHPVRGKLPNFYGLYDLHGNLVELTHDYIHPTPTNEFGLTTLTTDTTVDIAGDGTSNSTYRTVKGGTYANTPRTSRIATYGQRPYDVPSVGSGLRLVRIIP